MSEYDLFSFNGLNIRFFCIIRYRMIPKSINTVESVFFWIFIFFKNSGYFVQIKNGKQGRVTELALHLMKLNASDRLNYIDNFDDRGYKKNIVAKIRNLANVRAKMLLFFQFV